MVDMRRILGDEQSTIQLRHAAIASIFAVASVAVGIYLTILSHPLHEHAAKRVIWALAASAGVTGV